MLVHGVDSIDLRAPLAEFAAHGYARLGPVLSPDGADALRARSDALMLGESAQPGVFYQHDSATGRYADLAFGKGWIGPSLEYRKLEKLELDATFWRWIENPLFARIAHTALGDEIALYRAVLWNKAPRGGTELPWHQDDGKFWGLDRAPSLQIWTALDDALDGAGCLEVVPGSHRAGLASPEGGTIQRDALDAARAAERAVRLPARAGDAILVHNHLWHRSGRNTTDHSRRAIGISYLSGATRCTRRRRAPRRFRRVFAHR